MNKGFHRLQADLPAAPATAAQAEAAKLDAAIAANLKELGF